MTVGNFNPLVGSLGNDPLFDSPFADDNNNNLQAQNLDIIYGLQGNDNLSTADDFTSDNLAILVGGADGDQYLLRDDDSVVILDNGNSSEDVLIAEGIGFNNDNTFALTIDDRHLYAFDTDSDQYVLLVDWQEAENQIEFFSLAGGQELNYEQFVDAVDDASINDPNFLGDFTWEEVQTDPLLQNLDADISLEELGLSTEEINSAIDTVVETANNFEDTIERLRPNQDTNYRLRDTDNSYIFEEERYFYDFYSLPVEGEIDPGDIVQITASSDDFDPLLFVLDSRGNVLEFDNDSGDDNSAELTFAVGSGEPLFISVESRESDKEGDYELSVNTFDSDITGLEGANQPIVGIDSIGTSNTITGSLTANDAQFLDNGDTSFADSYLLAGGEAGQTVKVDLESDDFDTFLEVFQVDSDNRTITLVAENDDIDGGTNSSLDFTIGAEFDYLIAVSSFEPGDLGDYTLATEVI